MLNIIVRRKLKEGTIEQYLKCTEKAVAETRKEQGCIRYELCQSKEDPLQFAMFECWESQEHFNAHFETPHFKEFAALAGEVTAERTVEIYNVVR